MAAKKKDPNEIVGVSPEYATNLYAVPEPPKRENPDKTDEESTDDNKAPAAPAAPASK